jgi:hypothetical protein
MKDREKGSFDYEEDARLCSLVSSGNSSDLDLAEKLSRDSQYFCLTCKQTAADPRRLCSPSLK